MAKTKQETEGLDKKDQEAIIDKDLQRLTGEWKLRDVQMQQDRDLINLVEPVKQTTDYKLWLTSEPKVFFDTARALVSLYDPKFRLPIVKDAPPEQEQKMNKAERLCIGIFRGLNNRTAESGGTSWLYDLAYWALGGWYAIFALCQKGEEGAEFIADLWDPITIYPDWDKDGLSTCIRAYQTDKLTAEGMAKDFQAKGLEFDYQDPPPGQLYSVTNYWKKVKKNVYNAILINGGLVKPLTKQRLLDKIPVHVGAIGSPDKQSPNWQVRRGESIIAAARTNYAFKSAMRSLRAEIVDQTAYPNIVTQTRTGQPPVKTEDIRGHGSNIPLKLEDKITLLSHAATPQDALVVENDVNLELQKATFPNMVYGGIAVEMSGFAISQLLAAVKYKIGPYLNAMQFATGRVMTDLLTQYRKGKYAPITISTSNPYELRRGMTYLEEFSPDDVPERTYVEVVIPINSQFDKTQAILNSVQALQSGLMSRETLWENELNVDDAEQEKQRIVEDQVSNDPFIRQLEIIMRMYERVEIYKLAGKPAEADALLRYIAMLEANAGIVNKATGTPANPPGIPPNQQPPEMSGENPDMANAMQGKPPPSPNRPSKKPLTGMMVTPDGKALM